MAWRKELEKLRDEGEDESADALESVLTDKAEDVEADRGFPVAKQFYDVAAGKAEPLEPLSQTWLAEIEGSVTEQTRAQHKTAINLLLDNLNTATTVEAVTRRQAGKFISDYLVKSARATKTINRIISSLSSFWSWMFRRGIARDNVWRGQSLKVDRKRTLRAYTEDELVRLLSGTPTGKLSRAVLPDLIRLGLFTGARINEICSLTVADVQNDAFMIRDGKTEAATRAIPIHPAITSIVERRITGKSATTYLFNELTPGGPGGKMSWNVTKRFTAYRRSVGCPDGETNFHSLRRTFATALEQAGVMQNVAEELLGHKKQGMSFGLYSEGVGFDPLRDAVERVDFGQQVMSLA